jgi:endonuclease III-like uncharacterized protein
MSLSPYLRNIQKMQVFKKHYSSFLETKDIFSFFKQVGFLEEKKKKLTTLYKNFIGQPP